MILFNIFQESVSVLYATTVSTLCTPVESDFNLTSCERAMKCGSDSSQSRGISSSLSVYTRTSNEPGKILN